MAKSNLRANALCLAGLMARGMGYARLSATAIGRAVAICPDNPAFCYELGVSQKKCHFVTEAEASFKRAIGLNPGMAGAYSGLGDVLRTQDKFDDAVVQYERALSFDPDFALAHFGIGIIRFDQYRLEEAAKHLRRAVELDPNLLQAGKRLDQIIGLQQKLKKSIEKTIREICESKTLADPTGFSSSLYWAAESGMRDWALARAAEWTKEMPEDQLAVYTLTAIEGKASPAAPPDGYVEKLFDYAADAYNRNLQELSYQGPDLVTDMISRYFPAHGLDILDAGCGTGLNAVALKPYARTLTGIDLSSKMLEAARSRGSYDNLYKSDVVSFLKEHPSAYDLIAASDVFCYFGDLRDVIDAMAHSLRADGRIVFTVEHEKSISGTGWRLHPSGRYRHAEAYVREKLKDAGLTEVSVETRILRQELLRNVECLVVLARKES